MTDTIEINLTLDGHISHLVYIPASPYSMVATFHRVCLTLCLSPMIVTAKMAMVVMTTMMTLGFCCCCCCLFVLFCFCFFNKGIRDFSCPAIGMQGVEVWKGFSFLFFLNADRPDHQSTDLKYRWVEREEETEVPPWQVGRFVFNQITVTSILREALGILLRDGVERVRTFPSATMPSWAKIKKRVSIFLPSVLFTRSTLFLLLPLLLLPLLLLLLIICSSICSLFFFVVYLSSDFSSSSTSPSFLLLMSV